MNFSQLRQRAAFLAKQAGYKDVSPKPDWASLVNQGLTDWGWDTEYNNEESTFSTVSNQAEYSLPTPYWKNLREVIYATTVALRRTTETDEAIRDPLWTQRPATQPDRFIIERPNVIRLVDKPSAAGITVTIRGTRCPAALSADTDTPTFPDTWHEAVALRAAVLACESWATLGETGDFSRLSDYRDQYQGMVKECRYYLSGQRYSTLRRTVQRGFRSRAFLNGFGRPY